MGAEEQPGQVVVDPAEWQDRSDKQLRFHLDASGIADDDKVRVWNAVRVDRIGGASFRKLADSIPGLRDQNKVNIYNLLYTSGPVNVGSAPSWDEQNPKSAALIDATLNPFSTPLASPRTQSPPVKPLPSYDTSFKPGPKLKISPPPQAGGLPGPAPAPMAADDQSVTPPLRALPTETQQQLVDGPGSQEDSAIRQLDAAWKRQILQAAEKTRIPGLQGSYYKKFNPDEALPGFKQFNPDDPAVLPEDQSVLTSFAQLFDPQDARLPKSFLENILPKSIADFIHKPGPTRMAIRDTIGELTTKRSLAMLVAFPAAHATTIGRLVMPIVDVYFGAHALDSARKAKIQEGEFRAAAAEAKKAGDTEKAASLDNQAAYANAQHWISTLFVGVAVGTALNSTGAGGIFVKTPSGQGHWATTPDFVDEIVNRVRKTKPDEMPSWKDLEDEFPQEAWAYKQHRAANPAAYAAEQGQASTNPAGIRQPDGTVYYPQDYQAPPVEPVVSEIDALLAELARAKPGSPYAQKLQHKIDLLRPTRKPGVSRGLLLNPPPETGEAAAPGGDPTPPVQPGFVRFYHGGTPIEPGNQRWLTSDHTYARGYANKSGGGVYYVDIPADSEHLVKAFDDTGTDQTAPHSNFNAPADIAAQLKPFVPEAATAPETPKKAPGGKAPITRVVADGPMAGTWTSTGGGVWENEESGWQATGEGLDAPIPPGWVKPRIIKSGPMAGAWTSQDDGELWESARTGMRATTEELDAAALAPETPTAPAATEPPVTEAPAAETPAPAPPATTPRYTVEERPDGKFDIVRPNGRRSNAPPHDTRESAETTAAEDNRKAGIEDLPPATPAATAETPAPAKPDENAFPEGMIRYVTAGPLAGTWRSRGDGSWEDADTQERATTEELDGPVTPPSMVKKPFVPEPERVISVGPDAGTWESIGEDIWQNVTEWKQSRKWLVKTSKDLDVWASITQPPPRFKPTTRNIDDGPMAGTWNEFARGLWKEVSAKAGSTRIATTAELENKEPEPPAAPDEPPTPVTPPPIVTPPSPIVTPPSAPPKKSADTRVVTAGPMAGTWTSLGDGLWENEKAMRATTEELDAPVPEPVKPPPPPIIALPPAAIPRYTVQARPDGKFDVVRPNGRVSNAPPHDTRESAEATAAADNKKAGIEDEPAAPEASAPAAETPAPPLAPPATPAKKWKYEIAVHNDPKFYGNAITFATKEEAEEAASRKFDNWTQAREWRVVEAEPDVAAEEKPAEKPPVALVPKADDVTAPTDGLSEQSETAPQIWYRMGRESRTEFLIAGGYERPVDADTSKPAADAQLAARAKEIAQKEWHDLAADEQGMVYRARMAQLERHESGRVERADSLELDRDEARWAAEAARKLSAETLEWVSGQMSSAPPAATLRDLMEALPLQFVRRLLDDGAILLDDTLRDYVDGNDDITDEGKNFFEAIFAAKALRDPALLRIAPIGLLKKIAMVAPAIGKIQDRGDDWDITDTVNEAVRFLADVYRYGQEGPAGLLRHRSVVGEPMPKATVLAMIHFLEKTAQQVQAAFDGYARDAVFAAEGQHVLSFIDPPTPAESFIEHFAGDPAVAKAKTITPPPKAPKARLSKDELIAKSLAVIKAREIEYRSKSKAKGLPVRTAEPELVLDKKTPEQDVYQINRWSEEGGRVLLTTILLDGEQAPNQGSRVEKLGDIEDIFEHLTTPAATPEPPAKKPKAPPAPKPGPPPKTPPAPPPEKKPEPPPAAPKKTVAELAAETLEASDSDDLSGLVDAWGDDDGPIVAEMARKRKQQPHEPMASRSLEANFQMEPALVSELIEAAIDVPEHTGELLRASLRSAEADGQGHVSVPNDAIPALHEILAKKLREWDKEALSIGGNWSKVAQGRRILNQIAAKYRERIETAPLAGDVPIVDTAGALFPDFHLELSRRPYMAPLAAELERAVQALFDKINEARGGALAPYQFIIGLGGSYIGANIHGGLIGYGPASNIIALNPYTIMEAVDVRISEGVVAHEDRAAEFAQQAIAAAVHEISHQEFRKHSPAFRVSERENNAHVEAVSGPIGESLRGILEANGHESFEGIRDDVAGLKVQWGGIDLFEKVTSRSSTSGGPSDDSLNPERGPGEESGRRPDLPSSTEGAPGPVAGSADARASNKRVDDLPQAKLEALMKIGGRQFNKTPEFEDWKAAMLVALGPKVEPYLVHAHELFEDAAYIRDIKAKSGGGAGGGTAETKKTGAGGDNGPAPGDGKSEGEGTPGGVGAPGAVPGGTGGRSPGDVPAGEGERPQPGSGGGAGAGSGNEGSGPGGRDGPGGADLTPPVVPNATFFRIEPGHQIGIGGEKAKLRDNIAALKLLHVLRKETRVPTEPERVALARYVGWGGLSNSFKHDGDGYKELRQLLTSHEFERARRSTLNAHFTTIPLTRVIWDIALEFGFKGGVASDPAMAIGNFFGTAPDSILRQTEFFGSELDNISAEIAHHLYPEATIYHRGFEKVVIPDNSVDLFVSNFPFHKVGPYDPRYRMWVPSLSLHNYFFIKTLDKTVPNGMVIAITSTGTMDNTVGRTREQMAARADLIAAFRLPNNTFMQNARTAVTTDLLVFRKRAPGEARGGETFGEVKELSEGLEINEYYIKHPEHMFGNMVLAPSQHGPKPTLEPIGEKGDSAAVHEARLLASLTGAIDRIRATAGTFFTRIPPPPGPSRATALAQYDPSHVREFAYVIDGGVIKQKIGGNLVTPELKDLLEGPKETTLASEKRLTAIDAMKRLIKMRDAVNSLLRVQREMEGDEGMIEGQQALGLLYDSFVAEYGPLSIEDSPARVFRDDPQYGLLLSLENYDAENEEVTKGDIFTKRVQRADRALGAVSDDINEALLQVLGDRGTVDIPFLADLSKRTVEDVTKELEEKDLIYHDPDTGKYEIASTYLSGGVLDKLELAQQASMQNPRYERNVAALTKAQPKPLTFHEKDYNIVPKLGATWVPLEAYDAFINHLLRMHADTRTTVTAGRWKIDAGRDAKKSVGNIQGWGVPRVTALKMVELGLNQQRPNVYMVAPDGKTRVIDRAATAVARAKQEQIQKEFETWAGQDPLWSMLLEQEYNKRFNRTVDPAFDGSHLTFPGLSAAITPRPHQANAAWRAIQLRRALLAHAVGSGKTLTATLIVMELRRMGIKKKPMITVPNNLIDNGQWAAEFYKAYPGANLLVATPDDFTPTKRRTLMARIATGDWDAVIIAHSTLGMIPMSPKYVERTIRADLAEIEETLAGMQPKLNKKGKPIKDPSIKKLENDKYALEQRLLELADIRRDDTLNFDELGVDLIVVDESHFVKNLPFYSKMGQIAGLGGGTSVGRSYAMKIKTDYMNEKYNNSGVIFMSGTPVSNSISETYSIFRYIAPEIFPSVGIKYFDDWAANFGVIAEVSEITVDGQNLAPKTRFAKFKNGDQLIQLFRSFTDVKQAKDLNLPTPPMKGGGSTTTKVQPTPLVAQLVQDILRRAAALSVGGARAHHHGPDGLEDNWLKLTSDAKKIALDVRLFDHTLPDEPGSKANIVVDAIFARWQASHNFVGTDGKTHKGTQLAFADNYRNLFHPTTVDANGLPKKGKAEVKFNLYHDMRDKLIAMGIPAEEIAIMSEEDKEDKPELVAKFQAGVVRVMFGTTRAMGEGMNLQNRQVALHQMDAPWTPAGVEQRLGRIARQGNLNKEIEHIFYVTLRSYDGPLFQILETKGRSINFLMSGERIKSTYEEDGGPVVLNFGEIKAIATDNPDMILKGKLETELNRLDILKRAFDSQVRENRSLILRARRDITFANTQLGVYRELLESWQARTLLGGYQAVIDGQTFRTRDAAVAYLEANPGVRPQYDIQGVAAIVTTTTVGEGKNVELRHEFEIAPVDHMHGPMPISPAGIIMAVERRMGALENVRIPWEKRQIKELKARIKELEDLIAGQHFDELDKIRALEAELQQVNDRLNLRSGREDEIVGDPDDHHGNDGGGDDDDAQPGTKAYASFGFQGVDSGVPPPAPSAVQRLVKTKIANVQKTGDQIQGIFAPAGRGELAKLGGLVMRKYNANIDAKKLQVRETFRKAAAYFDGRTPEEWLQFKFGIEEPDGPEYANLPANEKEYATLIHNMLEAQYDQIRARSGMTSYIKNYYPHNFEKPEAVSALLDAGELDKPVYAGRGPLLGNKSFMKKRKTPLLRDALARGLKEKRPHPIDAIKYQMDQAEKYIAGFDLVEEMKTRGLIEFHFARLGTHVPRGFKVINDPIGTVYGPPSLKISEGFDDLLFQRLNAWARALQVPHYRESKLPGRKWGLYYPGGAGIGIPGHAKIETQFAGPESVLTHEIGHHIDYKYGLAKKMVNNRATRAELRVLADMRWEGSQPDEAFKKYVRQGSEKIANLVHAIVHAPEMARRLAPNSVKMMEDLVAKHPELKPLFGIKPSLVLGSNTGELLIPGLLTIGHYYAPEPVARIINNYLSPGLEDFPFYNAIQSASNAMVQAILAWSGFHYLVTGIEATAVAATVRIREANLGHVLKAMTVPQQFATAPFAMYNQGSKILQEFYNPGTHPELANIIRALKIGGGAVRMTGDSSMELFAQSWRRSKYFGAAGHFIPAAMEVPMHHMMHHWVPRLKLAAFAQLAKVALEELGPNLDPDVEAAIYAQIVDNIDDRFGQLRHSNLFWNKILQHLIAWTVMSPGWNIGTFRRVFGGTLDFGKALLRTGPAWIREPDQITETMGDDGSITKTTIKGKKRFHATERMWDLPTTYMTIIIYGSILYFFLWGKVPPSLQDALEIPWPGELHPDGTPVRTFLPSVLPQLISATSDLPASLFQTALNKTNPFLEMGGELIRNQDYYGTEIIHPADDFKEQALQYLEYLAGRFESISMRGAVKRSESGLTLGGVAASIMGLNPVPASVNDSRAMRLARQYRNDAMPQASRTKAQAARTMFAGNLTNELKRSMDPKTKLPSPAALALLDKAVRDQKITGLQASLIRRDARLTALQRMTFGATLDHLISVWDIATPQERDELRDMLHTKSGSISGLAPEDQISVRSRYDKTIAADSQRPRSISPPPP